MRIMAVDYGDARTGVAISDALGMLAGYTTVVHGRKAEVVAAEVAKIAKEHGVEEIVLGEDIMGFHGGTAFVPHGDGKAGGFL